jgi:acetyltransferase
MDVRQRAHRIDAATADRHHSPAMAIDPDPTKLETTLTLKDGRTVRVRPIRAEDAAMDRAFFAGLSEQSRYMRFMQHLAELTPRLVKQFTQIDETREMALVALDDSSGIEALVAVARYVAETGNQGETAEFAIVIADAWQGHGLGRALMTRLIDGARRHGLRTLVGSVLAVNAPMRALATALGFAMHVDPDDARHVVATLELQSQARSGADTLH